MKKLRYSSRALENLGHSRSLKAINERVFANVVAKCRIFRCECVCANFGLNTHSVCANFSLIVLSPVYSVHLVKIRKCMCIACGSL